MFLVGVRPPLFASGSVESIVGGGVHYFIVAFIAKFGVAVAGLRFCLGK